MLLDNLLGPADPFSRRHGWRSPMKFLPLHDRVVVRRIEAEEKTAGVCSPEERWNQG
jgi:hypothetical protein